MSDQWNEGYFTDVGYTYGYYREINPVYQRYCLLLAGFATPHASVNDHHAELGFGQGISVNIHAAANPGHYIGTDFNPSQAAHARQLAQASGSAADLYDDSFEQLLNRTDLPPLDSISLHGIWTWVSPENHKVIVEFARRHLKPGGLFYNSYNCFPGWSPAYPLRQLFVLHDRFGTAPHAATERIDAALKFTEALLAANPAYLKAVPQLNDRLKGIMAQNRHYLAHEYFNRNWNCMYFTDVADRLAPAKLDYACTAAPLSWVDVVNLTSDAQAFLKTIDHPLMREQARDYFVNQQFRKDIYVRGTQRLSPPQRMERLLQTRLVLQQLPESVPMKVNGPLGEASLQEAAYRPLLQALAANGLAPKTLREIIGLLPTSMSWAALEQAVTILVGLGAVSPCHDEATVQAVKPRCDAFNRHVCEQAQFGETITALASPVLGGGVSVNRFQQMFLRVRAQGQSQPQQWAQAVWFLLQAQGQRLVKEGKILETAEDNLAELVEQANVFSEKQLPILKALQIV